MECFFSQYQNTIQFFVGFITAVVALLSLYFGLKKPKEEAYVTVQKRPDSINAIYFDIINKGEVNIYLNTSIVDNVETKLFLIKNSFLLNIFKRLIALDYIILNTLENHSKDLYLGGDVGYHKERAADIEDYIINCNSKKTFRTEPNIKLPSNLKAAFILTRSGTKLFVNKKLLTDFLKVQKATELTTKG